MNISKQISTLPIKPGLYFFKNAQGQIIYIGKSVNLKNRVKSYWQNKDLGLWTKKMVGEIEKIEIKVLSSEFEALLEEAKAINKFQPHYNIQFKDDKRYLLIEVTKEDYPRILTVRKKENPGEYFGPFPSSGEVRQVLKTIRRIFGFRSCEKLPKKTCLYYHLKLCPGCCLNYSQKEYQKTISKIIKFLNGNIKGLIKELIGEMKQASKNLHFEKAEELKKQITAINYVVLNWQSLGKQSLTIDLVKDEQENILQEAKKIIPNLKALTRIEAYDISNLAGKEATGSMVVFSDLIPDKNQYRRFKIGLKTEPDDPGMIYEVLKRRLDHREWGMPNLMVIDGGKGQVSAVFSAVREKKLIKKINILGLAKEDEIIIKPEIYQRNIISFQEIKLTQDDPFLRLIQQVRDESHRFAKKYHLLLRKKKLKLVR